MWNDGGGIQSTHKEMLTTCESGFSRPCDIGSSSASAVGAYPRFTPNHREFIEASAPTGKYVYNDSVLTYIIYMYCAIERYFGSATQMPGLVYHYQYTGLQPSIHINIHSNKQANIHTHSHTCIHTYILIHSPTHPYPNHAKASSTYPIQPTHPSTHSPARWLNHSPNVLLAHLSYVPSHFIT